jgi:hypothetical protein
MIERLLACLKVGAGVKLLGLLWLSVLPVAAAPDVPYAPQGWQRWSDGGQWTVWLPQGATVGEQRAFFILAPGNQQDVWRPAWLGGAEVAWEGELTARGATWSGVIADDGTLRGLVAVSESGAWSLGALAPADEWEDYAPTFNAILRGEP